MDVDVNRIPYRSIVDRDVRAGGLNQRFDVIVVPDQRAVQLARGLGNNYPDSLRGGLGDAGAAALLAFAEAGGTILFFNDASEYAIEALKLPVRNVLGGSGHRVYARARSWGEVDRDHPIGAGSRRRVPAIWFEDSPTFEVTDPRGPDRRPLPATGDPAFRVAAGRRETERKGGAGGCDGRKGTRCCSDSGPVSGQTMARSRDLGGIGGGRCRRVERGATGRGVQERPRRVRCRASQHRLIDRGRDSTGWRYSPTETSRRGAMGSRFGPGPRALEAQDVW